MTAIQYPILNDQRFLLRDGTVFYNPINFANKAKKSQSDYMFYDRKVERNILPYICNNLLHRTDFFARHITYYSEKCSSHGNAESSLFKAGILRFLRFNRYTRKLAEICQKLFFAKYSIKKIYVTETMLDLDVIHIGYASTDDNILPNPHRDLGDKPTNRV